MAFLETSRYARVETVQARTAQGREVTAVALRVLPGVAGDPYAVAEDDRLDLIANRTYNDAAAWWHVADANTELDAPRLIEPGRRISVPPTR
jgi:nucleoid-associated protein YgaU